MSKFTKRVFASAGYNTTYYGFGREEFDKNKPGPHFSNYLLETAKGTVNQIPNPVFDEGVIASFMSSRFINQANLAGFLPFMIPNLLGKPCVAVEGACCSGGKALTTAIKSILSGLSDSCFAAGFEMQNTVKAVYGADILAGAGYYDQDRKKGHAHFFPSLFAERAGTYYEKYGYNSSREAMANWYKNAIVNARKNSKAQEFFNKTENLLELGLQEPDKKMFIPYLNRFDCSKVTDGASSIAFFSEEGLKKSGVPQECVIEIIGIGEAENDITKPPENKTVLDGMAKASRKALDMAEITLDQISVLEIHDCFTITAILAFEAIGFAKNGRGKEFILEGHHLKGGKIPTNLSGGLIGFGHPTGATGVRMLVDICHQLTEVAENQVHIKTPFAMMANMGGNDKTCVSLIAKRV